MKAVVASRNRHKVAEIAVLLGGGPWQLVTIDELAPDAELREDELTFDGNALAKARQAAEATGLPAFADDSGLEVDALNGDPGVRSARYAGDPCDDQRNNDKLLLALRGVPAARRTARYRCSAAFVDLAHDLEVVRHGVCEGSILEVPRGTGGFGYDPLFEIVEYHRTFGTLSPQLKACISHRARALRRLIPDLQRLAATENWP